MLMMMRFSLTVDSTLTGAELSLKGQDLAVKVRESDVLLALSMSWRLANEIVISGAKAKRIATMMWGRASRGG